MGEAKRKRSSNADLRARIESSTAIFDNVASALRRLATAASARFGADCLVHASLASQLLADNGIATDLVIGFAAWRVGNADGDVVAHMPMRGMIPQPGGAPYHAWLEAADILFDPSTYQLVAKARALDSLDGGHTNVDWCPTYLLVPKSTVSAYRAVTQGGPGLYHYAPSDEMRAIVLNQLRPLDQDDLAAARVLQQNPELQVFGPNTLRYADPRD